ncbi:MAG: tetratricopeptide repeat protein, partial [Deltaproteobacteria bacterium]|nr:tetratricopeptide repeat protein [Deltaproteobacteria bacterium]
MFQLSHIYKSIREHYVLSWLFACLILCLPSLAYGQAVPTLQAVSLGQSDEYSRLVFTFNRQLNDVIVKRDDVNSLRIDFGQAVIEKEPSLPYDDLVTNVSLTTDNQRLVAHVTLGTNHFDSRDFLSRDKFSLIVDFKRSQDSGDLTGQTHEDPEAIMPSKNRDKIKISPPNLDEAIRAMSIYQEPRALARTPERMGTDVLDLAMAGRVEDAINHFKNFQELYPNHSYIEPLSFILGDLYMALGLQEHFQDALDAWNQAINTYPTNPQVARASLMMGEASRLQEYLTEANGYFKLTAENYPDSEWAPLATLRAADVELTMGLNEEARATVTPLMEKSPPTPYNLLASLRYAMADYQDTLHSQASQRFRDALDRDPEVYELYPEMLYALGDSYSYLNRPDLTVLFLEHALNLIPSHPKTDVMLARIGNALQALGKPDEAISYFNIAKNRFPDKDGGLVSEIRLADMGALSAFFQGEQVFDALEWGTRQATVKMYDSIISGASPSPLLQLAYLKIGQAQAADGENSEAIKWLRLLVTTYPKGVLIDEARPILSRAVVNQAEEFFSLENYQGVVNLNLDNSSFLEGPDRLRFLRILAQSYEKLGRASDAFEVWQTIENESPERRLADQKQLIVAAIAADNPQSAFDQIKITAREFPEENDWLYDRLKETVMSFAKPQNSDAVQNLLAFIADPVISPLEELTQLALSEAIAIEVKNNNLDAASALMDDYMDRYPDDELSPEYLLTQAKIDKRLRRVDAYWNKLSDFRVTYPEDERVPSTIIETIDDARRRELYPDAWRYEELYRQRFPRDILGRNMLLARADEQWDRGYLDDSLNSFRIFQEEYPNDPEAPATYLNIYDKLIGADKPDEAFPFLATLRAKYPEDPLTKDSYIKEYRDAIKVGQPDRAFATLDTFRSTFPQDPRLPDLILEKAKDYFALGRTDEGLDTWKDFMASWPGDPRNAELLVLTARQEYREGNVPTAMDYYRDYLDSYPADEQRPQVLLELAAIEGEEGLNERAYND